MARGSPLTRFSRHVHTSASIHPNEGKKEGRTNEGDARSEVTRLLVRPRGIRQEPGYEIIDDSVHLACLRCLAVIYSGCHVHSVGKYFTYTMFHRLRRSEKRFVLKRHDSPRNPFELAEDDAAAHAAYGRFVLLNEQSARADHVRVFFFKQQPRTYCNSDRDRKSIA